MSVDLEMGTSVLDELEWALDIVEPCAWLPYNGCDQPAAWSVLYRGCSCGTHRRLHCEGHFQELLGRITSGTRCLACLEVKFLISYDRMTP